MNPALPSTDWVGLGPIGLCWVRLGWVGLVRIGSDWVGLGQIGLGRVGLDWARLGHFWVRFVTCIDTPSWDVGCRLGGYPSLWSVVCKFSMRKCNVATMLGPLSIIRH